MYVLFIIHIELCSSSVLRNLLSYFVPVLRSQTLWWCPTYIHTYIHTTSLCFLVVPTYYLCVHDRSTHSVLLPPPCLWHPSSLFLIIRPRLLHNLVKLRSCFNLSYFLRSLCQFDPLQFCVF